jgi:hypothetical protein
MLNPDLYEENSWKRLKAMLTKWGCVSGCSLVIRNSNKKLSIGKQHICFIVLMSWGSMKRVELNMMVTMLGQAMSNVKKEYLKFVKSPGHSFKGKKIMCRLPVPWIQMVCIQIVT